MTYTDPITRITHDFDSQRGRGMWFCAIHGRPCNPYGGDPVAHLLRKAAADPALSDDAFTVLAPALRGDDPTPLAT
jgi:hypothetical protein